jgi:hypothetical protein
MRLQRSLRAYGSDIMNKSEAQRWQVRKNQDAKESESESVMSSATVLHKGLDCHFLSGIIVYSKRVFSSKSYHYGDRYM